MYREVLFARDTQKIIEIRDDGDKTAELYFLGLRIGRLGGDDNECSHAAEEIIFAGLVLRGRHSAVNVTTGTPYFGNRLVRNSVEMSETKLEIFSTIRKSVICSVLNVVKTRYLCRSAVSVIGQKKNHIAFSNRGF